MTTKTKTKTKPKSPNCPNQPTSSTTSQKYNLILNHGKSKLKLNLIHLIKYAIVKLYRMRGLVSRLSRISFGAGIGKIMRGSSFKERMVRLS